MLKRFIGNAVVILEERDRAFLGTIELYGDPVFSFSEMKINHTQQDPERYDAAAVEALELALVSDLDAEILKNLDIETSQALTEKLGYYVRRTLKGKERATGER